MFTNINIDTIKYSIIIILTIIIIFLLNNEIENFDFYFKNRRYNFSPDELPATYYLSPNRSSRDSLGIITFLAPGRAKIELMKSPLVSNDINNKHPHIKTTSSNSFARKPQVINITGDKIEYPDNIKGLEFGKNPGQHAFIIIEFVDNVKLRLILLNS